MGPWSSSPLPLVCQPTDLHSVMAAALISNKPEFVKLFVEQGVRLKEFVTWDTLIYLYDNMAPSCLFHSKLQKVLLEEKEHTASSKMPRIQLHHVSQVLRELLGRSTQPLYPKPKHTERPRLSIPVPHIKLNVRIFRLRGGRVVSGRGALAEETALEVQDSSVSFCPLKNLTYSPLRPFPSHLPHIQNAASTLLPVQHWVAVCLVSKTQ